MKKLLPLLAALGIGPWSVAARGDEPASFAIGAIKDGTACVAMGTSPAPSETLSLLLLAWKPQRLIRARASQRASGAACDALASADVSGPSHALQLQAKNDSFGPVIVLHGAWSVRMEGGRLHATSKEFKDVQFRECTSSEGVHLSAWAGVPLKSRRIWDEYFYLGYDVEPTCDPKDYD